MRHSTPDPSDTPRSSIASGDVHYTARRVVGYTMRGEPVIDNGPDFIGAGAFGDVYKGF